MKVPFRVPSVATVVRSRRLAAFGAGVVAWESVVHASLLASGSRPKVLGVRLTPFVNAVQTIVPAIFAVVLARRAMAR